MFAALLVVAIYSFLVWLVFFRLRWMKFSITWGFLSTFVGLHLLLIILVGLRFITPASVNATVIQHTIQLVPRLPEPTLVTAVLIEPNVPIRKGQVLFQFDRRPYEYKVQQLQAELARTKQDVLILKAEYAAATQNVLKARSELEYARYQYRRFDELARQGAGPEEDSQKWSSEVQANEAAVQAALAGAESARLKCEAEIGGVNTTVAEVQAQLDLANYYLENTALVAPEDGYITNLQVRPGMVSGSFRIGAIASFIVDADRYLLATYYQEHLKYVKEGQPVEIAMDLYPGRIFDGKVDSIWWASGEGQLLPSGDLPKFHVTPPDAPQGLFAVKIYFDERQHSRFPIGAQGTAVVYTKSGGFAILRRIAIRAHSWLNWLYPLPG